MRQKAPCTLCQMVARGGTSKGRRRASVGNQADACQSNVSNLNPSIEWYKMVPRHYPIVFYLQSMNRFHHAAGSIFTSRMLVGVTTRQG